MTPEDALGRVVREEWGRLIALLLARFRRLDLVEEALADAVEAAARRWPRDGAPEKPAAWLQTTASRRVIDRLRAEEMAHRKFPLLLAETEQETTMGEIGGPDEVEDDLLRLVLMCTHPALDPAAASALTLRLVLGVSTEDVARLFLVPTPTMAARITRAKKKIVAAGIPFAVPDADDLPARLAGIARTAYLAFTAGYAPGTGPDALRVTTAGEAIRLVRVVLAQVRARPGEPVLAALLALMLLQHSRRDARADAAGDLVLLADQDRSLWRHEEIAEASGLLESLGRGSLEPLAAEYALQALIALEHAGVADPVDTRWDRIAVHYAVLEDLTGSPMVRLARAVAVAEAEGPRAGLAIVDTLAGHLAGSHRLSAVEAELASRLGDGLRARSAYDRAIELCGNDAELRHLRAQRAALG